MSRTVQATLELAPTQRFLDWAKGDFDVGGTVVDTIYVRRNFADKDVGQLMVDARSKSLHRLLELLRLCGTSRQQAEQYLLKEILTALEHTVYRNKILAVHLADTRRVKQGEHHRTVPIMYSNKEYARMQIFTEDVGVAASMHDNDQRVRIRLEGDNHVELAFTQIVPREKIEQKRAALLQDRETRALQAADQYQPARKTNCLEAHLKLTITAGQEPIVRGWSSLEVEAALIEALGGLTIEIVGVLIPTHNTRADFEGRSPTHIFVMDRGEQTDGETHLHKALADRLQKGTALRDEKHFPATRIRLKGTRGVVSTLIPPSGQSGPAMHAPLSKIDVLRRIENAVTRTHLYLVAQTLVGSPVVFPGQGRTCTTMTGINQVGSVDKDGDIQRQSVLKLFKPGEVTLEIVLECLKEGEKEGMLIIYDPAIRVSLEREA